MRVVGLMLLAGCSLTQERFPDRYAEELCARSRSCEPDQFEERWDDRTECRTQTADFVWRQLGGAAGEDCPFDASLARDCLDDVNGVSCEELGEGGYSTACEDVLSACLADDIEG